MASLVSSGAFSLVVADASLVVKWLLPESGAVAAQTLLAEWLVGGVQPIVPTFLIAEVANVLYREARAGTFPVNLLRDAVREIVEIVGLYDAPLTDTARAMEIAAATGQSTPYDALYLALAEREGCELWTADARFPRAAVAQFPQVHLFMPT